MSRPAPTCLRGWRVIAALSLAVVVPAVGCDVDVPASDGEASDAPSTATAAASAVEPATWTLSDEPLLEIGVVDGEKPYQLHQVRSSTRLPDGRIVVANAGSGELRFYGAAGVFLGAQGARGDGPGDWRTLDRVRPLNGDTLLVIDGRLRRNGLVDGVTREYLGALPWRDDLLFPADEFLQQNLVVHAPLPPERRGVVTRALALSGEYGREGGGRALATSTAYLWVAGDPHPGAEGTTWRVYDLEGRRLAAVTTPPRFVVHDVGPAWVLGVWTDDLDVQHVRLYGLDGPDPGASRSKLARAAAASDARPPDLATVGPSTYPEVAGTLDILKRMQEIYYSTHYRYSFSLDSLIASMPEGSVEVPDGLRVAILEAHGSGWMGSVLEEATGGGCTVRYGDAGVLGLTASRGRMFCLAPPGVDPAAFEAERLAEAEGR